MKIIRAILCGVFLILVGSSVCAQTPVIPGIEAEPINEKCPVTGEPIGDFQAVLWGHTIGFATESAQGEFQASSESDRRTFVLSQLKPINTSCPIDGTPVAQCKAVTLYEGFAIACCDDRCAAQFMGWEPGPAGVYIQQFVAPINTEFCAQTGDELVPDDPYYVAHQGRLMQLCCDYCLMEFQYQPALRDGALIRALGIEAELATIALP